MSGKSKQRLNQDVRTWIIVKRAAGKRLEIWKFYGSLRRAARLVAMTAKCKIHTEREAYEVVDTQLTRFGPENHQTVYKGIDYKTGETKWFRQDQITKDTTNHVKV